MNARRRFTIALAAALGLGTGLCAPPSLAQNPVELHVGYIPAGIYAYFWRANEAGYFAQENLKVNLTVMAGGGVVIIAEREQRIDRPAGVAHPGEAVVPVARAPDRLRQRSRRRRHDRPRRREDAQLQRQQGADHRGAPGAVVARAGRPGRPELDRAPLPLRQLLDPREDGRLAVGGAEREQPRLAGGDLRLPLEALLAEAAVREPERVGAAPGERPARPPLDPGLPRAVAEARLDPPAHPHRAGQPLDAPQHLAQRREVLAVGQRHQVGDAHRARGRAEGRLEDVRVLEVRALRLERLDRLQLEAAAALGVEDPAEDRRRVDVGRAEPVDRPVAGDERARAPVADHRVVADRRVAVDAVHPAIICASASPPL